MKKSLLLRICALSSGLVLLFSLAACSGSSSTTADTAAAQNNSVSESYDPALTETSASGDTASDTRKLVTTAQLNLDVTDFDGAVSEIEEQAAALGGYFSSSSRGGSAEQSNRWAEYHARIPSSCLSEFLDSAGGTGTVTSLTQGTTDITAQYVDNEARLESLRTQEQRLLELLGQAGTLEDLILLEDKLTEVRYEIETITGQQKLYDNQVEYATVDLWVNEVSRETITAPTFGDRIIEAFYGSFQNVTDLAQGAVILLIYLAPLLLFFTLAAGLLVLLVRRSRRTKKSPVPPSDPPKNS